MPNVQWTVTAPGQKPKSDAADQIEHIPLIKASEDGADAETVRLWNLMVKTLRANNLMKAK